MYYRANKARINTYNRKYYAENSERLIKYSLNYVSVRKNDIEFVEKRREVLRNHYRNNTTIYVAKGAKRRVSKLRATPVWSNLDAINALYKECAYVSKLTGIKHVVDHEIPLQGALVSGLHVLENLRIVPELENLQKGNKFVVE